MKHDHLSFLSSSSGPAQVLALTAPCALRLDPDPLAQIYAERGAEAASETVCRALEVMAERLNRLVLSRHAVPVAEMAPQATRIAALADQVGLIEVSAAARHVAICAGQDDAVALDATLARLERAFDTAISQPWSFDSLI